MQESDLYPPVKKFLELQKYVVKAEIRDCDVMAVRDAETPVIVELKLTLNLTLILQAVDRLALTSKVYIGVPKACKSLHQKKKKILKLLRMLGIGLLEIDPINEEKGVTVLLDPKEYRPRQSKFRQERLLGEFEKRVGDPNLGGKTKRKGVMTAYRQQAIRIATLLQKEGALKAALVAKILQEPKARDILYRNVYGWFERVSVGIYRLSPRGEKETCLWQTSDEGTREK